MLQHSSASRSSTLLLPDRGARGPLGAVLLLGILLAAFSSFSRSAAAPTLQAPAGSMLYFTDTREIRRYDLNTGALIDVLVPSSSEQSHDFVDLTFGPDGKLYVLDGLGGQVRRYDAQTGALLDTFIPEHAAGLISTYHLAFGPDGYLYIGGQDAGGQRQSKVVRYNTATGAMIDTIIPAVSGDDSTVQGLTFGSDNNLYVAAVASGGIEGYVLKYDGATGALITTLIPPGTASLHGIIWGVTFGPACSLFLLLRGGIQRYNAVSGDFISTVAQPGREGHGTHEMALGPDGSLYVAISTNEVERYNSITGELIDTFVPASQTYGWNNFTFYIPPEAPQSLPARAYLPLTRAC